MITNIFCIFINCTTKRGIFQIGYSMPIVACMPKAGFVPVIV